MPAKIKNIKFVNVFWLFFYLLIFGILLKNGLAGLDPDFGWHLKVGEEISLSGEVPRVNYYNYTYRGNWVDHEWLADLGIYQAYQLWGYNFLVVLFALITLTAFILLHWYIYKKTRNSYHYLALASLQFLGIIACLPHLGVRIQALALLFVLLTLILIMFYEKRKHKYILFLFLPLMFLWANLHASFLLGLFLLFSWAGVKVFEKILFRSRFGWMVSQTSKLTWHEIFIFFGVTLSVVVATFFTPYRLELYSFLSGYKNKAYLSLIQEWLPQYVFPFHYDQIIFLALGLAALFIYLREHFNKRQSLDWWQIFLVITFLILGIKSRRHFPLFFIVSLPLLIQVYSPLFYAFKEKLNNLLKTVILVCLFLAAITPFFVIRSIDNPFDYFCKDYPCEAVDFLRNNPNYLNNRVFNNYGWGGFLIFVLPEQKLFIDGRLPQVEFAGKTFIEEYYNFFKDEQTIADKLSEYQIELVVTNSADKIIRLKWIDRIVLMTKVKEIKSKNRLREYLANQSEWQEIYDDGVTKIYALEKSYEN